MTRILFVCLGNQCRSPMAEYIFKKMLHEHGLEGQYYVESAGTLRGINGRPVHIPAKRKLDENGIDSNGHYARQLVHKDYYYFDYIVCMDLNNMTSTEHIVGEDDLSKICLLKGFPGKEGQEIADPMVTGDYNKAYQEILCGCKRMLAYLEGKRA